MDSPDTNNAPADDMKAQPDSTDDPSPVAKPEVGNAVDDPQNSLVYWYLCSDYAAMRLP